jgi:hypothetical protein
MNDAGPAPELPTITSRSEFVHALKWTFKEAVDRGARTITWVAPGFAAWPLDESDWMDLCAAWLRLPGRRLQLISSGFDAVPREHPRFTRWRRDWSHAIDAWAPEAQLRELPTWFLCDRALSLQLHDDVHWRGRVSDDAALSRQLHEQIDDTLQRCERAFPVQTLGL